MSAQQLAHDAVTLVGELKKYDIGKDAYGPSWARISSSDAASFLPIAAAGGVTGYTVHNYVSGGRRRRGEVGAGGVVEGLRRRVHVPSTAAPAPPLPTQPDGGKDCNVSAYLEKDKVTVHLKGALAGVTAVRDSVAPGMLLVLEEVAGSSGGGCDGVTDRFVAGFAWLATLATVGEAGFDRLHRQGGWAGGGGG